MKNKTGLWIDFKQAVIVINLGQNEKIKHVAFHKDKNSPGASSADDMSKEDSKQVLINERKRYYDDIISHLRIANRVLIMGPGKAKDELHKRLVIHGFDEQTVVVKPAEKMSDEQIVDEIHRHFL